MAPAESSSASHCCCTGRRHRRNAFFAAAVGIIALLAVSSPPASLSSNYYAGMFEGGAATASNRLDATVSDDGTAVTRRGATGTIRNDDISTEEDKDAAAVKVEMKKCPRINDIVDCPAARRKSGQESDIAADQETIICRDCIVGPWVDTFYAAANNASRRDAASTSAGNHRDAQGADNKIYLPLLVPPFFGSSVLSNILSSSPMVTNMCRDPYGGNDIPWQCEPTSTLIREGVFKKMARWDPDATDFTKVYEVYHRLQVWTDMDAPIRLEKAPPNFVKAKRMVEYFDSNGLDYRFVVLMRHPCRMEWSHPKFDVQYSVYLRNIVRYVPQSRRFFVNYDDLVTRPGPVMEALLEWFPLLTSLSLGSRELGGGAKKKKGKKKMRKKKQRGNNGPRRRRLMGAHKGGSLRKYVQSDKCRLGMRDDVDRVPADQIDLWEEHFAAGKLLY